MARARNAIVVASTVEVECPHCGEPQPSPDNGSHQWFPSQVSDRDGQRGTCTSCDESFTIHAQSRVSVGRA